MRLSLEHVVRSRDGAREFGGHLVGVVETLLRPLKRQLHAVHQIEVEKSRVEGSRELEGEGVAVAHTLSVSPPMPFKAAKDMATPSSGLIIARSAA